MGEEHRRPSIATIFNPRRSRGSGGTQSALSRPRPSVVVTDEDSPLPAAQFTNGRGRANPSTPRGSIAGIGKLSSSKNASVRFSTATEIEGGATEEEAKRPSGLQRIKQCIFSVTTRKLLAGLLVICCVTSSSVGTTHLVKDLFLLRTSNESVLMSNSTLTISSENVPLQAGKKIFDAPFFATWFCTAWSGLFFPLYLLGHSCFQHEKSSVKNVLKNIAQHFRDRGITFGKFVTRCVLFCLLWVANSYMYINSLRILDCTDVMALYAAHISFVYLLSWVILHEQFVGVRIVAVIMCNTGIALLAYMDGITRTKTLLGVVMAAAAAAGSAVFKVLFKKVVGDTCFGHIGLYFTCIAFLNVFFLSPFAAVLYLTEYEVIIWSQLPWVNLLIIAALNLAGNLLCFFGISITFEIFITLGIIFTVPISAALDVEWYGAIFEGMKLAGIVLIGCGFFLVLFPANWPQYITKLLRWGRHRKRHQHRQPPEPIDYRTGLISRSHLRSPSGLIR